MRFRLLSSALMAAAVVSDVCAQTPAPATTLPAASASPPVVVYENAPASGPRLWGGAEYLMWWVKNQPAAP